MVPRMSVVRRPSQGSPVSFKRRPRKKAAPSSEPCRICSARKATRLLPTPPRHRASRQKPLINYAAGFGLGGLDEAVNAFEDGVVDAGDEPAEDAILMATDGFGDVDDGRDAAVGGPKVPLVEEWFGLVGGLTEEVLEDEADLVGAGGFQMGVDDVQGVELFPLAGGEVLGVLEPDVAGADEF